MDAYAAGWAKLADRIWREEYLGALAEAEHFESCYNASVPMTEGYIAEDQDRRLYQSHTNS